MVVEDIFPKLCAKPTVFKNTEILRKGHHPCSLQEVLHRDGVIIQYSTFLKDAMFGIVPDNILIYGTFGVGKTMLTKLITSELVHAVNQAGRNCNLYLLWDDECIKSNYAIYQPNSF